MVIFGLTSRFTQPERTAAVKAKSSKWIFRGIADKISINLLQDDQVHLTDRGLSQIRAIQKNKVLNSKFSTSIDNAGHSPTLTCRERCNCGLYIDHKSGVLLNLFPADALLCVIGFFCSCRPIFPADALLGVIGLLHKEVRNEVQASTASRKSKRRSLAMVERLLHQWSCDKLNNRG